MVAYNDIHISDLKNLSVKSFTEILINDYYPFIFSELFRFEENITYLSNEYDVEMLETVQKKIYSEFDALYRKEKLVLFPFILKLEKDNRKSENCTPFKNVKSHYVAMIQYLDQAIERSKNFCECGAGTEILEPIIKVLHDIKNSISEVQHIKECFFFKQYKTCKGCKSIVL